MFTIVLNIPCSYLNYHFKTNLSNIFNSPREFSVVYLFPHFSSASCVWTGNSTLAFITCYSIHKHFWLWSNNTSYRSVFPWIRKEIENFHSVDLQFLINRLWTELMFRQKCKIMITFKQHSRCWLWPALPWYKPWCLLQLQQEYPE